MSETLKDMEIQRSVLDKKIRHERSIKSFIKAASNSVGHFLTVRNDGTYARKYLILFPITCRWEYSDMTSSIEEEFRYWLDHPAGEFFVSIEFCP